MGKSRSPKTAGAECVYKQKVVISLLKILLFSHEFMGLKVESIIHRWISQLDCRAVTSLRAAGPMLGASEKVKDLQATQPQ